MYIRINDQKIFYKKSGHGRKSFVLLHNAGGNHQFFRYQMKTLSQLGTVYALDLPGYGHSPAKNIDYGTRQVADIVAALINEMGLQQVILIGLNNGANIGIEIAARKSLPIKQLILIDPILFMRPEFVAEINDFIKAFQSEDVSAFVKSLIKSIFIKASAYTQKIAYQAFMQASKAVVVSALTDLIAWSQAAKPKLELLAIPTLIILSDEHHCPYQPLVGLNSHINIAKVVGSRCWATLEVPEQINAMIKRVIQLQEEG